MKAAVEYPAGNVFKNSFKAPAVEATIEATKKLEGKELAADAYTFELKENGAVVAEAKNTAEGKVALFVHSKKQVLTLIPWLKKLVLKRVLNTIRLSIL